MHAINILKALYQDTSLGSGVLQYASQGTVMAVSGFASSSWAVRNASMQLFGKPANNNTVINDHSTCIAWTVDLDLNYNAICTIQTAILSEFIFQIYLPSLSPSLYSS